jgi:hypothetical protein
MQNHHVKRTMVSGMMIFVLTTSTAFAQLDQLFKTQVFDRILRDELQRSPGSHAQHYFPAAEAANRALTPGLNALIASNVSSFPLTATIAGVTFDISAGRPVKITESLGPIFSETAETLGKGKLNAGFEYTYLNLAEFRGVSTEGVRFAFTHQDVDDNDVLGNIPFEADFTEVTLGMDVNASIYAWFATYGVLNDLDVGVAIPVVNVNISGEALSVINGPFAGSSHFFGDLSNPLVNSRVSYQGSATGLGDIALRLKYNFVRGPEINLAGLLDVRLPTGDQSDFLGTGETSARFVFIGSRKLAQFTPHMNVAYDRRPANLDSDELEFTAGFDQKMAEGVTIAFDLLGEIDINRGEALKFFDKETATILQTQGQSTIRRELDLTNIPQRDQDNTFNASLGLRIAASEKFLFLGNVLVPLNQGSLRSSIAPTIGLTINL